MSDTHALLSELGELSQGSRTAALAGASGRPLFAWGTAWAVAYCALGWLDGSTGPLIAAACFGVAALFSWLPRSGRVRNGWESRLRTGWGIVLAASPALVSAAGAIDVRHLMLLLGVLWSLAMALYAVAVRDRALGLLMLGAIAVGGLAPHQTMVDELAVFGLAAGLSMAVFGAVRWVREATTLRGVR